MATSLPRATMASTANPWMRALGARSERASCIDSQAPRTASGPESPSATPPASDRWTMSGETTLSATG